jgi:hypothetical protein
VLDYLIFGYAEVKISAKLDVAAVEGANIVQGMNNV